MPRALIAKEPAACPGALYRFSQRSGDNSSRRPCSQISPSAAWVNRVDTNRCPAGHRVWLCRIPGAEPPKRLLLLSQELFNKFAFGELILKGKVGAER
jgi:hypothetical protein